MSTIEKQGPWSNIGKETIDPKYEKCRNIAEEIYKRINITFQIKKLESGVQSDVSDGSDQIDSNELSNETDLFACDKSSLSSSTDVEQLERAAAACEKYININNNEEQKKPPVVTRRPRKRFRKRIKKTQKQHQKRDSDGSSDEGPPLSLVAELGRPPRVPRLVLLTADLSKFKSPSERKSSKKPDTEQKSVSDSKTATQVSGDMLPVIPIVPIDYQRNARGDDVKETVMKGQARKEPVVTQQVVKEVESKSICSICSLPFRSERGLRRHMSITHQTEVDSDKKRTEQRVKPA